MSARTIPYASANAVELAALDADTLAGLFQAATNDDNLKGLMPMLRDEICRRWMNALRQSQIGMGLRLPAVRAGGVHTGARP